MSKHCRNFKPCNPCPPTPIIIPPPPSNLRLPSTAPNCLGVIQGQVDTSSGSAVILHGRGFSATVVGGFLNVTLLDPLLINPTVLLTGDLATGPVSIQSQSSNTFSVFGGPGVVNFVALGPCPPSTNPP